MQAACLVIVAKSDCPMDPMDPSDKRVFRRTIKELSDGEKMTS